MSLTLFKQGLILVAVPLACELLFLATQHSMLSRVASDMQRQQQAREICNHANEILRLTAVGNDSFYNYALTGQGHTIDFEQPPQNISAEFAALKSSLKADSSELSQVSQLEQQTNRIFVYASEARRSARFGDLPKLTDNVSGLRKGTQSLSVGLANLIAKYQQVESSAQLAQQRGLRSLQLLLLSMGIVGAIQAVLLLQYFMRTMNRRLEGLKTSSKRFAELVTLPAAARSGDELNQLDSVLRETVKQVVEAADQKHEFMGMVAHDLRAPLTAVFGALQMLAEGTYGTIPPRGLEVLGRCERNIERLIQLIGHLLDLQKWEAGRMKIRFEEVPLAFVLDTALQSMRTLADQKGVRILMPDTDLEITADGDYLVQVMINLLSNALRFSPSGGTIRVSYAVEGDNVTVRISDEGPGIALSRQTRIFERYEQAGLSLSERKYGSGLGLAICKRIIEQHQGTIAVESRPNEGSTFFFTIPIKGPAL